MVPAVVTANIVRCTIVVRGTSGLCRRWCTAKDNWKRNRISRDTIIIIRWGEIIFWQFGYVLIFSINVKNKCSCYVC